MDRSGSVFAYAPLNTPKQVAPSVWIVDGPPIRYGPRWLALPFPTRMTVIRLDDGLFVHSPTQLTPELRAAIEDLGIVRWLVAPNRLHYWWIAEWHAAWPTVEVWLAPKVRAQAQRAGRPLLFETRELGGCDGYPWDGGLRTVPVTGGFMTEFAFFHSPTRTLVLTDWIENFEPERLSSLWMRWLTRVGGVQHPDGQTPRDLRMTFRRDKHRVRLTLETLVSLDPQRVILAHGRWYARDGQRELRRAFRWALR